MAVADEQDGELKEHLREKARGPAVGQVRAPEICVR
jgi:hypothetical protein